MIHRYDARMNPRRAAELNPEVLEKTKKIFASKCYEKLFICAGKNYLPALKGYDLLIPRKLEAIVATGSSGHRQAELHDWLHSGPPPELKVSSQGEAVICGKKIALTPQQIIDIACRALAKENGVPFSYQAWYVPINGHRIAPKWLVSQLTGLSVGSFHTDEARRVLAQLGIRVLRV